MRTPLPDPDGRIGQWRQREGRGTMRQGLAVGYDDGMVALYAVMPEVARGPRGKPPHP
jgi:hypothetical protein